MSCYVKGINIYDRILIVSHSPEVAQGVKVLAEQMAGGRTPIAAAGGAHDGSLGTSVDLIAAAIATLHGVEGILALVDLGSAVMSAEMALEATGTPYLISGAPLVEGAVLAAVEAGCPGADLAGVAAAAARALEAKGVAVPPPTTPPADASAGTPRDTPVVEATITVTNKVGLHMRPASEFVRTAARFPCSIHVRNLDRPERPVGDARSILDVMKLGVLSGQRVHVRAEGQEARTAVAALAALVADNFGEE